MGTIYSTLLSEEQKLRRQIEYLQKQLEDGSEDILEISYSKGHVQYYHRPLKAGETRQKRLYIRKSERGLAENLAQRDYNRKLIAELEKRWKIIEKARSVYEQTSPEKIGSSFNKERQELFRPLILSNEQFVLEWQDESYEGKPIADELAEILTARGERVRSKSEKIIADTLVRHGIPYKYECPLDLPQGLTVYPDFRVLNVAQRREFIWEHLGMMDNESYASKAVTKINTYMRAGYFPGITLILTMESTQAPLSTRIIEMMIEQYLKD